MEEKLNQLLIDDIYDVNISIEDVEKFKIIQKAFMESYVKNKDKIPVEIWLKEEVATHLPEKSDSEIDEISRDIIDTLKTNIEKQRSLESAIESGRSKESWFASEVQKACSVMTTQETMLYLKELDNAIAEANNSLHNTLLTQVGRINQNPHLDGFIAEQYHAQTFNLNAKAKGSPYRAKVLESTGKGYVKNSVDVVITDSNGKIASRYQSKYCKNADATLKAYNDGDYRGQQLLVPEEQSVGINKKHTTVIEAPDGTKSNPLSKNAAKDLQNEAQSGNWNDLNWNDYKTKDLAIGIGKQAGQAAAIGAAIGVGFNLAQQVWNDEEIEGEEIVETALVSGADFGIKSAAAGALKVSSEKGLISSILKESIDGTTAAHIAHVAIENVKVISKMADGELTAKEGFEKMEQTTVATVAGMSSTAKGAVVGAKVGAVFGPVGSTIGSVVGGAVAYMGGSKVGETVVKGVQKVREVVRNFAETVWEGTKSMASSFCDGLCNFGSSIASFLGF